MADFLLGAAYNSGHRDDAMEVKTKYRRKI